MKLLVGALLLLSTMIAVAADSRAIISAEGAHILTTISTQRQAEMCLASVETDQIVCYFNSGEPALDQNGNPMGVFLEAFSMIKRQEQ